MFYKTALDVADIHYLPAAMITAPEDFFIITIKQKENRKGTEWLARYAKKTVMLLRLIKITMLLLMAAGKYAIVSPNWSETISVCIEGVCQSFQFVV